MDYTLKTSTESEMRTALLQAGLASIVSENALTILLPLGGVSIDCIGAIPNVTGFHANVRVADGVEYDPTNLPVVFVTSPYRIWA